MLHRKFCTKFIRFPRRHYLSTRTSGTLTDGATITKISFHTCFGCLLLSTFLYMKTRMSEEYKVGSLSDVILKTSQSGKKKSSDQEISKLATLFSSPAKKSKISVDVDLKKSKVTTQEQRKGIKRKKLHEDSVGKQEQTKNQTESRKSTRTDGYNPPPGIVHESLISDKNISQNKQEEEVKKAERKPRHKNRRDRTKDPRTIFVGNLPITFDKKELMRLFRPCGKIESVRFRCPPPADLKLPKRAIAITKTFHKERPNIISYVCFEDEESANRALCLNGQDIDGFHIRVDISTNAKKHDDSNTVFIGNMTYDITENEVWNHFEDCGEIENVRIIRDNKTGMGKGIGYIQFQDKDSVEFALKLHQSELKGRQVRVIRSNARTAKKQKRKMLSSKDKKGQKPDTTKDHKKLRFTSTNKKTDPFQHINKDKKHKKKTGRRKEIKNKSKEHSKNKNFKRAKPKNKK